MEALAENQESSEKLPDRIRKIDLAEAFKLRFKNNLSFQAIADHFGCKAQSVYDALAPFSNLIKNSMDTSIYEANKAGILTAVQFELVKQMTDKGKLKAASLNNIAYSLSQLDNMIRLEKGQPTAITEHLDTDLGGMIDQLCGMKSAGSGSTVDVTPAAAAPMDILESLEAPITPIPTQAPDDDRSTQANVEPTIPAAKLTKSGLVRKPRTTKPTKSTTNSRKQNTSNITASLDSKVDKEWYE
jgi:predicted DNA-binding protein YlxM (UPF0122 family)